MDTRSLGQVYIVVEECGTGIELISGASAPGEDARHSSNLGTPRPGSLGEENLVLADPVLQG
jgi:hypothetical protein